jgi:hypothetical protein
MRPHWKVPPSLARLVCAYLFRHLLTVDRLSLSATETRSSFATSNPSCSALRKSERNAIQTAQPSRAHCASLHTSTKKFGILVRKFTLVATSDKKIRFVAFRMNNTRRSSLPEYQRRPSTIVGLQPFDSKLGEESAVKLIALRPFLTT